jgi:hypothetical protein
MKCALPADRSTMEVEGVGFLKILQASGPTDGGHFGNSHRGIKSAQNIMYSNSPKVTRRRCLCLEGVLLQRGRDVRVGSCAGMASTRSVRLLYPRIADYLVALSSTVKVCHFRTHAPQQITLLLDHPIGE